MKASLVLSSLVLFFLVLSPAVTALETVSSGISRTVTLDMSSHDAYKVEVDSGSSAIIEFTADLNVDFYVMTALGYVEYTNPNSSSFSVEDSSENARSFSFSTAQAGLIFVVDNDAISTSGASPTGPVTYVITVVFSSGGGPTVFSVAVAIVAGALVFGAIAFVLLRQRRKRQSLPLPQQGLPFQPQFSPIPTPVTGFVAPVLPIGQAPGAIRRSLNSAEREMLVRDFKGQKAKLLQASVVGLVLAVAYIVLANLFTLLMTMIPFISAAVASQVLKLRRAIVAGQVIEFQGIPAMLGSTRVAKQDFYRLQFGTESVLVPSSLQAQFVPNQPGSLTVLQGADLALAVNGVPLPKGERVRFDTQGRAAVGWG